MPKLTRRSLLGGSALLAAAAATGYAVPRALADDTAPKTTAPFRFTLPAPTGPHPLGTTELHLVDRARTDPWVPGRSRELMVSVWYPAMPARRGRDAPLAPYLRPGVAAYYDRFVSPAIGLAPGQVDYVGVRTHARAGVAAASRGGRRPVVLYSPGFGVPRAFGTVVVEELASRGYVVVTVDHTYEASVVEFPDGRIAPQTLPDQSEDRLRKAMKVREQDMRFVLDQLASPPSGGRPLPRGLGDIVDRTRIGMFGHSAGGVGAADVMYADRRVRAGVDMDGFLDYGDGSTPPSPVAEHGLDRPFLMMGAAMPDGTPRTHHNNSLWRWLWDRSTGPMLDLNVPAGRHYTFTDYQAVMPQLDDALGLGDGVRDTFVGTVAPARIVASHRAYITAFFDEHLRGRPQPLLDGPSPHHPDVTFVR